MFIFYFISALFQFSFHFDLAEFFVILCDLVIFISFCFFNISKSI